MKLILRRYQVERLSLECIPMEITQAVYAPSLQEDECKDFLMIFWDESSSTAQ